MAFEPKMRLTTGLKQSLVITPQLKHAIKILQLSRMDLEQLVSEEMEQNPTLEELGVGQEEMEAERETATPESGKRHTSTRPTRSQIGTTTCSPPPPALRTRPTGSPSTSTLQPAMRA